MVNTNLKLGYYFSSVDKKLYGPFSSLKECEKHDYINIWKLEKTKVKDSKVNKITIDFLNTTIKIEGEKNCAVNFIGKTYGVGTYEFQRDQWERVVAEAKKACSNIVYKGLPEIEGEYLNEVLHL